MSKGLVPAIRAAKEWKKRPTTLITGDDWYGHRSPLTGGPVGDRDEWVSWDHALAYALQTIEDFTDDHGILAWEKDDEAVVIDAIRKIDPFREAMDQKTAGTKNKPYKPAPGEYFVPKVWSRRKDGEIQTFTEWIESQAKGDE